jgi:large subunit ribosomal protein L5
MAASKEKEKDKKEAPKAQDKPKGDKPAGGKKEGKGKAATQTIELGKATAAAKEPPRFKQFYGSTVIPSLRKQFGYKNPMQVPRLQKIVINMGLGESTSNPKIVESAMVELTTITGQRPVLTRSKKAISNFKLRAGLAIGAMVTLRHDRMWEFLDRLVSLALPRVRDFKGVSPKGFDGRGNYTLGMREQIVFPEIEYDKVEKIKGMNISFVTTAKNDDEGRALLTAFGMPFRT